VALDSHSNRFVMAPGAATGGQEQIDVKPLAVGGHVQQQQQQQQLQMGAENSITQDLQRLLQSELGIDGPSVNTNVFSRFVLVFMFLRCSTQKCWREGEEREKGLGAVYTCDFTYESAYDSVYDLLQMVSHK
jgi:hypothetical protein